MTLPGRHPPADERCAVHALADSVTGVGEATAQNILDEISLEELVERCEGAEGPHGHPVTLTEVDGIGPTRAASIAEAVDDSPLAEALDDDEDDSGVRCEVGGHDVPEGERVLKDDRTEGEYACREHYPSEWPFSGDRTQSDSDDEDDEDDEDGWTCPRCGRRYPEKSLQVVVGASDVCESCDSQAVTDGGQQEEDDSDEKDGDDPSVPMPDGGVVESKLSELTAFQRDALRATIELQGVEGATTGSEIRRQLEATGYGEVTPGRLYLNLDTLVDRELVEKGSATRRSNDYQPTSDAERLLRKLAREIGEAVGLEVRG